MKIILLILFLDFKQTYNTNCAANPGTACQDYAGLSCISNLCK